MRVVSPFSRFVTLLIALFWLLPFSHGAPQDTAPIGRLSLAIGEVSYREGNTGPWKTAPANLPLTRHMEVRTGPESRAELTLATSIQRLDAGTTVRLAKLEQDSGGRLQGVFELVKGSIYTLWNDLGAGGLRVQSPNAVMAIRGTRFTAETGRSTDLEVKVYEGQVDFSGDPSRTPPSVEPKAQPPAGPPSSVSGPSSVPGPRSVSLEEWTRIRAGMSIVVRKGKAVLAPFETAPEQQPEWIRWNQQLDNRAPRD